MRAFNEIEREIAAVQRKIKGLEKAKEETHYSTPSTAVGKGIRALIWSSLASFFLLMLFEGMVLRAEGAIAVMGILTTVFSVLTVVALVGYVRGSLRTAAAIVFSILSGSIFFIVGVNSLLNAKGQNLLILLGVKQHDLEKFFEMPLRTYSRLLVYSELIFLIPITILLFSSIAKIVQEVKKKNTCLLKETDLAKQIQTCQNALQELKKELGDTKKEATRLFAAEKKKEYPDKAVVKSIASLGLDSADAWLKEDEKKERQKKEKKRREENFQKGKQVYEDEIKNAQPDLQNVRKAADLGYPEACIYVARELAFDCMNNSEGYSDEEKYATFKAVKKYIGIAGKMVEAEKDKRLIAVLNPLATLYIFIYGKGEGDFPEELSALPKVLREWKKEPDLSIEERTFVSQTLNGVIAALNTKREMDDKKNQNDTQSYVSSSESYEPIHFHCRYEAAGVCMYHTTSVCKINCMHLNDPYMCSYYSRG